MNLNKVLHLCMSVNSLFACVRACARQGIPRARECFVSRETQFQHCTCKATPFAKNHIGDGHAPDHGI